MGRHPKGKTLKVSLLNNIFLYRFRNKTSRIGSFIHLKSSFTIINAVAVKSNSSIHSLSRPG